MMHSELRNRVKAIASLKHRCDAIYIQSDSDNANQNFVWLTDSTVSGAFFYDFSKPELWIPEMELLAAKKSWVKPMKLDRKEATAKLKQKVIGMDFSSTPASTAERIKKECRGIVDISKTLEDARSIKTKLEIKRIKKACSMTRGIFSAVRLRGTEARIRAECEYEIMCKGLKPAFDTIVASRAHIAAPHHIPTKSIARKQILIDAGVRYKNYNSDVTRTWGSKFEQSIERVFEEVEKALKPGVKCSDIDNIARKAMGKYEKHFITALGHGIGVSIHEKPIISSQSSDVLKIGMIFTIEPGIYIPNGIRIENMYLMKEDGVEKLTDW
jgi:Xaa-Pro aminopeptidase